MRATFQKVSARTANIHNNGATLVKKIVMADEAESSRNVFVTDKL